MKANFNVEEGLLQNQDKFANPYFNQRPLRHNTEPLQVTDKISKNYLFPTCYGDVTCAIGIFFCDYGRAEAIMPHKSIKPVKGTKGRAVVIFSCYEYKQVMNVAPYNEIAMTIPVMKDAGFSPPLLPLVMKSFKKMGYHVFSMPVTSFENTMRGQKLWGLPKVTEDIFVDIKNDECTTTAFDENGTEYFRLTVPTNGKPTHFDEKGYLYSVHNDQLLKSQTNFKGDFNVIKNMGLILKKNKPSTRKWLQLGDSPRAEVLKSLQIEESPFQFRFTPSMMAQFDLAEERF